MDIQLYQYHPVIGFHFIPNLKTRIEHEGGGYLLRTNSAGFRSEHEFTVERTGSKRRILLFGDSFTAGDGVSNKKRYGDVLETLLPETEVYNFALPGTGTDQHYLVYREIARAYEHDLIVIAAQVENIRRVVAHYRLAITAEGEHVLFPKPYFELSDDGSLTLNNVPVRKTPCKPDELAESEREFVDEGGRMLWLRRAISKLGKPAKELAQRVSNYQPLPQYENASGSEWQLMKAIFRQWAGESRAPVIIMPIPLYQYVEETASAAAYQARFDELSPLDGVTIHDPLPDYLALPREERRGLRFKSDIHPTPAHHALLANSLLKSVRRALDAQPVGVAAL
jgi:lysophospholipase L1-like esterase